MKVFLPILSVVSAVFAQSILIGSPSQGQNLQRGAQQVVRVLRPVSNDLLSNDLSGRPIITLIALSANPF